MINETTKIVGDLSIVLKGPDGQVKDQREVKNLVVTTGLGYIAARMITAGLPSAMSHMGVGTGSTAADVGQTDLVAQHSDGRIALDSSAVVNATTTYIATFGAGTCTGALTEAGIFNAGTAGTMLCRTVFSVINKGALDSMIITWNITAT